LQKKNRQQKRLRVGFYSGAPSVHQKPIHGFVFRWGPGSSLGGDSKLMPEKVATITGLRGMFRSVGGAFGISIITIILHSSSTPANGLKITFLSFGLGLLFTIPLVFLMPTGRKGGG